jgi:hypothetical protein
MSVTVNPTRCGKTTGGLDAGVVLDDATALVPTLPSATLIDYLCVNNRVCNTCYGDVSGNNRVTTADISALVSLLSQKAPLYQIFPSDSIWNECADCTKNGKITTADLSTLISWLTPYPPTYSVYCSAWTH